MKLENTSKLTLSHENIVFTPGTVKEIPEHIAKIWLKIDGIKQYINPVDVKKEEEKAAALLAQANEKIISLEKEIKDLQAKLEKATAKKETKKANKK